MTRGYKVVIMENDEVLLCRVADESNFLPLRPFKDKIQIGFDVYNVWEITYILSYDDEWVQEIKVRKLIPPRDEGYADGTVL